MNRCRALLLLCTLGGGVSPDAAESQQVTLRDSAGVVILRDDRTAAPPTWSVSDRPDLRLGGPTSELWQLRAVIQTDDGRVVVLSGGTLQVHVFGPDGGSLAVMGGRGGGPCEFTLPMTMALAGADTLHVVDRRSVKTFLLDGSCVGSTAAPTIPAGFGSGVTAQAFGRLSNGMLVYTGSSFPTAPAEGRPFRLQQYFGVGPPGEVVPLSGSYLGVSQERIDDQGGMDIVAPPFARASFIAVSPEAPLPIAAVDTERFEVHLYDESGELRRIVRGPVQQTSVRPEWVEAWKERQRARDWTSAILPRLERQWARMTVPETLPALQAITLDSEGLLWVQRVVVDPAAPIVFDVFDLERGRVAEVTVPAGMSRSPHIGRDYLVAVWEDGLGVETVERYRLVRRP